MVMLLRLLPLMVTTTTMVKTASISSEEDMALRRTKQQKSKGRGSIEGTKITLSRSRTPSMSKLETPRSKGQRQVRRTTPRVLVGTSAFLAKRLPRALKCGFESRFRLEFLGFCVWHFQKLVVCGFLQALQLLPSYPSSVNGVSQATKNNNNNNNKKAKK